MTSKNIEAQAGGQAEPGSKENEQELYVGRLNGHDPKGGWL
ncbi:MAG: hypothetical protein R6U61_04900 [Thermoplasmata archaeon]